MTDYELMTKLIDPFGIVNENSFDKKGNLNEFWFHKYTQADNAIIYLKAKGYKVSERQSNKHKNTYFKFKIQIERN